MRTPRPDHAPTHTPLPMSCADFARRVQRSKPTIHEAVRGPLKAAMLANGRVDAASPVVAAWLAHRGISPAVLTGAAPSTPEPTRSRPTPPKGKSAPVAPPKPAHKPTRTTHRLTPGVDGVPYPDDLAALGELPFREVVARYGTVLGFADHTDVLKRIEEIERLHLQNEQTKGRLIEREFVQRHVFGMIDGAWRRIVMDSPRTIAARVSAGAIAGVPREQLEKLVRDLLGDSLRHVKTAATKRLKAQGSDHEPI